MTRCACARPSRRRGEEELRRSSVFYRTVYLSDCLDRLISYARLPCDTVPTSSLAVEASDFPLTGRAVATLEMHPKPGGDMLAVLPVALVVVKN